MLRHEGKCNVLDVLIVDDDPKTRQVLREILEPLEHSVFEAGNGRQALPLVEQHDPDLMIIDILMPEMDGLETIRFLRSKGYRMPIIAMPAGKDVMAKRYSEIARSFGADDILPKPFRQADVLKVLRRTLGQVGSQGEPNSSATG
jgi:CheY-like chemotaxis protein